MGSEATVGRRCGRRLAAALALAAGCAAPARERAARGDGAAGQAAALDNPFRDPSESAAREDVVQRFLRSRGIALSAEPESAWVALDAESAVVVTIANSGPKPLRLVGERSTGGWPFTTKERARAVLHAAGTWGSLRTGLRSFRDAFPLDLGEDVVVAPGATREVRLPLPIRLPAECECARVAVRAVLHPLSVEIEGEPERVVALRVPDVEFSFAPAEVAAAQDGEAALERALAERPREVVSAALRCADRDRAATVERLLLALPGPDAPARRARFVALEWVSGERLGDSVERWRSWWEAQEGRLPGDGSSPAGAGERRERP